MIEFLSDTQKQRAKLKLKDCLYREKDDTDFIFAFGRVNDEG